MSEEARELNLTKLMTLCVIILTLVIVVMNSFLIIRQRVTPADVFALVSEMRKDIEDRDERLRTAREVISEASSAVVEVDNSGTIMSWNSHATTVFGYESKYAIGRNIEFLMPDEYKTGHGEGLNHAVASNTSMAIERKCDIIHKLGHRIPVSLSIWVRPESRSVAIITPERRDG